ncbi:hypothetical protein [Catenulispora acidiphila]|uniref:hypothetical protein n=1 Tax=Catenulispora acidiphila TaxID=304895 RepID=UPI00117C20DC|nr:hypothetical protein [Catenulispora acidiphila]
MKIMGVRCLLAMAAVGVVAGCGTSGSHPTDGSAGKAAAIIGQPTSPAAVKAPTSPSYSESAAVQTNGGRGYSATLSARLLNVGSAPTGFSVRISTTEVKDPETPSPSATVPCSDAIIPLLSVRQVVGKPPSAMASATLSNDTDPDHFWVGGEVLRTYNDGTASQVMTEVRALIGHCPIVNTSGIGGDKEVFRYAVAPGPRLGDDSAHVSCSMTTASDVLECDTVLVRIGTGLVAVFEEGSDPGGSRYLPQLAAAALQKYQAAGS